MTRPRAPRQSDFGRAVLAAREDWRLNQNVTAARIQDAYYAAAQDLRTQVQRHPGTITARRELELALQIEQTASRLNDASLEAIRQGAVRGYQAGLATSYPQQIFEQQNVSTAAQVRAHYQTVNNEALATFIARTGDDGLTLSDRVWNSTRPFVQAATTLVEHAVTNGLPARELASNLGGFLAPGVARPSSMEVRRNLGLPADVSYQAIRLARTEINTAAREGTVAANNQSPFLKGFRWVLSRQHVGVDECTELAEADDYDLGPGVYPPDAAPGPDDTHPNCLCTIVPVYPSSDEMMETLGKWLDDPNAPGTEALGTFAEAASAAGLLPEAPPGFLELVEQELPGMPPLPSMPEPEWGAWTSVDQAVAAASSQYPNVSFDFDGVDLESASATLRGFREIAEQYPEVAAKLKYVGTYRGPETPSYRQGYQWEPNVYAHATRDGEVVGLNPRFYNNSRFFNESLQEDLKLIQAGKLPWHPEGDGRIEDVIKHELGHQVQNWLDSQGWDPQRQGLKSYLPVVGVDGVGFVSSLTNQVHENNKRSPVISGYSKGKPRERWAEAFGAVNNPNTPPKLIRGKYVQALQAALDLAGNDSSQWLSPYDPQTNPNGWRWLDDIPHGTPEREEAVKRLNEVRKRLGIP